MGGHFFIGGRLYGMRKIKKDVVIIGAGASGMMCAIEAGKRGRSVILLDHMDNCGKKIRASGGGRCNFTNIISEAGNYLSENPHFCKSALARFTSRDFIAMIERHGIAYSEREKGQLFCKKSSIEIVKMLHEECIKTGAEIRLHCKIGKISRPDLFSIAADDGIMEAESLVIATGGLSYPNLGATDIGYRIAGKFGLKVTPLKPALVPFVWNSADRKMLSGLSGISIDAIVGCGKRHFRGELLFTHRGISGPAILQISSYWIPGNDIVIDLMPDIDICGHFGEKSSSRTELDNIISEFIPKSLSRKWCELNAPARPMCSYSEKEYREIAHKIHNWTIRPGGTEGYNKAEITCGGISTDELSSKTMEARSLHGLFFIGEVVDVAGQLGGYNLQWAWSSGFAAGQFA